MIKKMIRTGIERCFSTDIDERYGIRKDAFQDKVVVVTGGNGDIGRAIADRILMQGGKVVITGRKNTGNVVADGRESFVCWDVSDLSDRCDKIQECIRCFGKIDIWVNCAGCISRNDLHGDFLHATEEDWKLQMDVNAKALFFLTQTAAQYFKDAGIPGYIVQVLSIDGIRDTWQPYGISKRVAIRFTQEIARVLEPYGIKVSGVAPGG